MKTYEQQSRNRRNVAYYSSSALYSALIAIAIAISFSSLLGPAGAIIGFTTLMTASFTFKTKIEPTFSHAFNFFAKVVNQGLNNRLFGNAVPAPARTSASASASAPAPAQASVPAPARTSALTRTSAPAPAPAPALTLTSAPAAAPAQTSVPAPTPAQSSAPAQTSVPAPTPAKSTAPAQTSVPAQSSAKAPARTSAPAQTSVSAPTPAQSSVPAQTSVSVPAPARTSAPAQTSVPAPTPARTSAPAQTSVSTTTPAQSSARAPARTLHQTQPTVLFSAQPQQPRKSAQERRTEADGISFQLCITCIQIRDFHIRNVKTLEAYNCQTLKNIVKNNERSIDDDTLTSEKYKSFLLQKLIELGIVTKTITEQLKLPENLDRFEKNCLLSQQIKGLEDLENMYFRNLQQKYTKPSKASPT